MGFYAAKPAFQRTLLPIERLLVRCRVHADVLTGAALVLSVAGAAALAASPHFPLLLLAAPVVALVRMALNALDGMVARSSGQARPWGEVLNEVSDRGSDVALFGALGLAGYGDPRIAAAAVVAMLIASYTGVVAKAAGGRRQYGGVMGKVERMAVLSLTCIAALLFDATAVVNAGFAIVLAGSAVTTFQRLRSAHRDLRLTQEAPDA